MNVSTGRSIIVPDPRRPRRFGRLRPMLAVWCWCGRFYTVTPEVAARAVANVCPDCSTREVAA